MKWLLIVTFLFLACEDYYEEEYTIERWGLCGEHCLDEECIEFFNGTFCMEAGIEGRCVDQVCWHHWPFTCETGEPIQWP